MTLEWILTMSVLLYIAGSVLSVLEEWPKQGLTDTSYLALALWSFGMIGVLVWSAFSHYMGLSIIAVATLILTLYAVKLKLHDHRQYWKGLSLHTLRMRGRK